MTMGPGIGTTLYTVEHKDIDTQNGATEMIVIMTSGELV